MAGDYAPPVTNAAETISPAKLRTGTTSIQLEESGSADQLKVLLLKLYSDVIRNMVVNRATEELVSIIPAFRSPCINTNEWYRRAPEPFLLL